jgi:hypothetical protein
VVGRSGRLLLTSRLSIKTWTFLLLKSLISYFKAMLKTNKEFKRNMTLRTTNTLLDSLLSSESNSKLLTALGAFAKIKPRLSSKTLTLSTTPLLLLKRNSNQKAMPHSKRFILNGLTAVSLPTKVLTNTLISSKISTLNYNLSNISFHESN